MKIKNIWRIWGECFLFGGLLFGLWHSPALAVEVADFGDTFGLVETDLIQIVISVVQWMLGLLGLIAVILLIYAGFLWMTAAGDKVKIDRAKNVIRNALIGLVIILLSWAIVLFVQNFFDDITNDGPPGGGCPTCGGGGLDPTELTITKIETSCGDGSTFQQDVFLCSSVQVNFNHNLNGTLTFPQGEGNLMTDPAQIHLEQCLETNGDCSQTNNYGPMDPNIQFYSGKTFVGDGRYEWTLKQKTLGFWHVGLDFKPNWDYRVVIPKGSNNQKIFNTDAAPKYLTRCIDGGCQDSGDTFVWEFQTGTQNDTTPPEVVRIYPVSPGDPDYPDRAVPLYPLIKVEYSEPIVALNQENLLISSMVADPPAPNGSGGTEDSRYRYEDYMVYRENNALLFQLNVGKACREDPSELNAGVPCDQNPNICTVPTNCVEGAHPLFDKFTWHDMEVSGVMDLCGNPAQPLEDWRFQTNATEPRVRAISPPDQYAFACSDVPVTVKFNQSMYRLSSSTCQVLGNTSGGYVLDGEITHSTKALDVTGEDFCYACPDPENKCRNFEFYGNPLPADQTYAVGVRTDMPVNMDRTPLLYGGTSPTDPAPLTQSEKDQAQATCGPGGDQPCNWSFGVKPAGQCANPPFITRIDPPEGEAGRCVTIFGRNFTPTLDPGEEVTFNATSATVSGDTWNDQSIVTTVPSIGIGDSDVVVRAVHPSPIGPLDSPAELFPVISGTYTGPCLYSVQPNRGNISTQVNLTGERFGDGTGLSRILYNSLFPSTIWQSWGETLITRNDVPDALWAAIHPVQVRTKTGAKSNAVPFTVTEPEPDKPQVTNYGPTCQLSCINAIAYGSFTLPVVASGVNETSIRLYRCTDSLCEAGNLTSVNSRVDTDGHAPTEGFTLTPDTILTPQTWYRVIVRDDIRSADKDQPLGNLNFDEDGDVTLDAFSWKFKTKNDSDPCALSRVAVEPDDYLAVTIADIPYRADVYLDNAACSEREQRGDPTPYTFDWDASTSPAIQSIVPGAAPNFDHTATVELTGEDGSSDIQAQESGGKAGIGHLTVQIGGFACKTNQDCEIGMQCPGSKCINGFCTPVINDIEQQNAIGDWMWINGCLLGKSPGTVTFNGPPAVNGLTPPPNICGTATWTNTRVVIEVPNEQTSDPTDDAVDGTVTLIRNNSEGGSRSNPFPGFQVKPTDTPDVCLVDPSVGYYDDAVQLKGKNFDNARGSGEVAFSVSGDTRSSTIDQWSENEIRCRVPYAMTEGLGTVTVTKDAQSSTPAPFTVQAPFCGCQADNECSDVAILGCGGLGAVKCCYPRPTVESYAPVSNPSPVCRNSEVSVTFDQEMDVNTITEDNFRVEYYTTRGSCEIVTYGQPSKWARWMNKLRNLSSSANAAQWCAEEFTVLPEIISEEQGEDVIHKTRAIFSLTPPLLYAGSPYRITVIGDPNTSDATPEGVLSKNRVGMNGDTIKTFDVGQDICEIDDIRIDIDGVETATDLFTVAGTPHRYTARAYSEDDHVLNAAFEWTILEDDPDNLLTLNPRPSLPWDWTDVTAASLNGTAIVEASVNSEITEQEYGYAGEGDSTVNVRVDLCEYPWEFRDDAQYHYILTYCRGNDADQLLPYLEGSTGSDYVVDYTPSDPNKDELLQQRFFILPGEDGKEDLAIGVQIWENYRFVTPRRWYDLNESILEKSGSLGSRTVDGYEAIFQGRTTYTLATNALMNGQAPFPNIMVFSYAKNADGSTDPDLENIYAQLLNTAVFNTNVDGMCGDEPNKACLIRDTKRITDLGEIGSFLAEYKLAHGNYPPLDSGSYLPGHSTSLWPSWNQTLGRDLRKSLATDPENGFVHTARCLEDLGYAEDTCWNENAKLFQCEIGSRLYHYRSDATTAELLTALEYAHPQGNWIQSAVVGVDYCSGASDCSCYNYLMDSSDPAFSLPQS
jgi:hypothetical protein